MNESDYIHYHATISILYPETTKGVHLLDIPFRLSYNQGNIEEPEKVKKKLSDKKTEEYNREKMTKVS